MTWHLLLTIGIAAAEPLAAQPSLRPVEIPKLVRQADTSFVVRGWNRAAARYAELVESNPTVGLYWYRWGESLRRNQRPAEAIVPLQRAEELGAFQHRPPRTVHRGEVAFSLAAAHAALGHYDQALEWTRTSLAQGLRQVRRFHADEFAELLDNPDFRRLVWAVEPEQLTHDEGYRLDLRFAIAELKRVHYAPFRATSESDIDAAAAALSADIAHLSDDAIFVRMMAILRQFGDGHTAMRTNSPSLPVSFFVFPEGLFIIGATAEHADLVGAKVLAFGDTPVAQALATSETLVARENPMMPRWLSARILRLPVVLRGLGWAAEDAPVSIRVEDATGQTRDVELEPPEKRPLRGSYVRTVPNVAAPVPLYLRHLDQLMWHEVLPDGETVYCQLNGITNGRVSLKSFCQRLFKVVEQPEIKQLVLDLRFNGGGNTFLNPPLIDGLIRSDKLREPGRLFVVVGRNTFSAALNTLDEIERRTPAIVVGEPTSSPPNFVGETVSVVLPYSRWRMSISDLSWQTSQPMDYRVWVSPTLYAPPTAVDFLAHRDPALEVVTQFIADQADTE